MLESLSGLNRREVQGILSSVTLSLLPNPYSAPKHAIDDGLYQRVLAESREKLSIASGDETAETCSQLADFLGNQISESVLRGVKIDKIKARLGEKGFLQPEEYVIDITSSFREFMESFQFDEAEIIETVSKPDDIQHIIDEHSSGDFAFGVSVCAKMFGTGQDRYALFIGMDRRGYTLCPNFAWRVFFSDVGIQPLRSALEVAKAFAEHYGLRYQIGNLPPKKFYENEIIIPKPGSGAALAQSASELGRLGLGKVLDKANLWWECGVIRRSSLGPIIVRFSFVINIDRYSPDLERHGIKVKHQEDIDFKEKFSRIQIGYS